MADIASVVPTLCYYSTSVYRLEMNEKTVSLLHLKVGQIHLSPLLILLFSCYGLFITPRWPRPQLILLTTPQPT